MGRAAAVRAGVGWAAAAVIGAVAASAPGQSAGSGAEPAQHETPADELVDVVAFGSCFNVQRSHAVWDAVLDEKPDVFVMLGDNVYADTVDADLLRAHFAKLDAVAGFSQLRERATLMATWDDHDYGLNDMGGEHPNKSACQEVFLDWAGEPEGSERRETPGVYTARMFGPEGRRVQVIVLDTRTFRSPLSERPESERGDPAGGVRGPYAPTRDRGATVLGEEQWAWLGERLREPARVRLVASSIQVVAEDHRFESWSNFPAERERLFELIRETGAEGVVFLSGDRHLAELSRLDPDRGDPARFSDVGYPLYDLTSSSLNVPLGWRNEINRHRVGSPYFGPNYGVVEINWLEAEPTVVLNIRDEMGGTVIRRSAPIGVLRAR